MAQRDQVLGGGLAERSLRDDEGGCVGHRRLAVHDQGAHAREPQHLGRDRVAARGLGEHGLRPQLRPQLCRLGAGGGDVGVPERVRPVVDGARQQCLEGALDRRAVIGGGGGDHQAGHGLPARQRPGRRVRRVAEQAGRFEHAVPGVVGDARVRLVVEHERDGRARDARRERHVGARRGFDDLGCEHAGFSLGRSRQEVTRVIKNRPMACIRARGWFMVTRVSTQRRLLLKGLPRDTDV